MWGCVRSFPINVLPAVDSVHILEKQQEHQHKCCFILNIFTTVSVVTQTFTLKSIQTRLGVRTPVCDTTIIQLLRKCSSN